MSLTDSTVKAAKPRQSAYKLFDTGGLYMIVSPAGGRWWRFRYRFQGREKLLSLGVYPDVSLRAARDRRDDARKLVADNRDPSALRQAKKAARADSFQSVAEAWLAQQAKVLQPESLGRVSDRLQVWVYPALGRRPIAEIEPLDLLSCFRHIESQNRHETAHRTRADCSRVFRYAVASGLARRDPTADLRGALTPIKVTHFASITTPTGVGELMRSISGYRGQPSTEIALKLIPYLFVRPGELRAAEWSEFDLDSPEPVWRIPAKKMKMRRAHIVPLSRQAVALLRELDRHTGDGRLLFPTLRDPLRPMSENTLNACLRRMGYTAEQMTSHGFRSMASTLLNEQGVNSDLIERQLAHQEQNASRSAYNRAEHLKERSHMMQQWADYLDGLRDNKGRTR